MATKHTPLVIGNWKMNPLSISAAKDLFYDVRKGIARTRGVDIAVAPPFVFLPELRPFATGKNMRLAAQDTFFERLGAYTGEVSVPMLKNMGVKYVIVGHSERRGLGETDEIVGKKVAAVLREELIVVVCVGENKRDTQGHYLTFVEKQLRAALKDVSKTKVGNVVIAYEPVWAIGTGKNATADDAHEMKLFIQKIVSDLYGRNSLSKMRIIYGGSVSKANAEELFTNGNIDGFLVGGASLRASEFVEIAKIASAASK